MARSRVRWSILLMAFLANTINYIDRANLGVAAPYLQREFGLSPAALGTILGAFFWSYAAMQLPAGWLVDRIGVRLSYALAVGWWSLFTAACGLGRGLGSLFGLRLLLGAGEAPAYPCNAKVVAEWFPGRERAFATSVFDSGARVGTALSLPIVSLIIGLFGWRISFAITGLLGLVWAAVWLRMYRAPRQHPRVSPEELAYIEQGRAAAAAEVALSGVALRWRDLFRYRAVWGMMLGFFCLNFVIYFFITWFPTYLIKERGFTLLKLGLYGMIPALVSIVAEYLGGLTSDGLVRRGVRLTLARKLPIVVGMVVASSIGFAVLAPSAGWALALLALSYSGLTFAASSVLSLPADIAPTPQHVASLAGIQNFAANLGGIGISQLVGMMVGRTGGFVVPLVVAGGFAIIGALSYLFVVPEIEPLRPRARRERAPLTV